MKVIDQAPIVGQDHSELSTSIYVASEIEIRFQSIQKFRIISISDLKAAPNMTLSSPLCVCDINIDSDAISCVYIYSDKLADIFNEAMYQYPNNNLEISLLIEKAPKTIFYIKDQAEWEERRQYLHFIPSNPIYAVTNNDSFKK